MPQRLAPLGRRIDGNSQPLVDLALPDHVAHALRAKIAVFVGSGGGGLEDRFAGHGGKCSVFSVQLADASLKTEH